MGDRARRLRSAKPLNERPRCACHDEPMIKNGVRRGTQRWVCRVRVLERMRAYYSDDPVLRERKKQATSDHYAALGEQSYNRLLFLKRRRTALPSKILPNT